MQQTMPRRTAAKRRPARAAERAALHHALRAVTPFADDDLAALPAQALALAAGTALLRAGERATEIGFVLEGGLREYFVLESGEERTKGFNLPGDFTGSLSDLLSGGASRAWIVAERPSTLLVTPWRDYLALVEQRSAWQRFARLTAETLYRRKAEREYELLALDAAERLRRTLARWPTLETVYRQRHIASYVGISPVHLSRLRGALRRASDGC